jgi:hypothetical protein
MMDEDLSCGMGVISAELARHAAGACAAVDMSSNREEAARHCAAMQSFVDHMQMRSAELAGMMGAQPAMMDGATGAAGTDGGWMMADGGWMGWDHQMPGCSLGDGGYSMMDGGMPWLDGGFAPGWDGGMPMDAGMPFDGGMPGVDGGMPGPDGGMPDMDGGPMMDGGRH